MDSELEGIHDEIVSKKKILKERKVLKTTINHPIVGRGKRDSIKPKQIVEELEPLQMETEGILKRGKKRVRPIASDRDSEEIESKLTHKRRAADGEQVSYKITFRHSVLICKGRKRRSWKSKDKRQVQRVENQENQTECIKIKCPSFYLVVNVRMVQQIGDKYIIFNDNSFI